MLEAVARRILRAVFGGGGVIDIDIPTEFDELKAALVAATEAAIDTGTATGGSNVTIVDTGKSWEVNMWVDATYEVEIGATHYLGIVISNNLTTITFAVLPGGAAVIAGCKYGLKRPVDIADISDRAARLLGVVTSLTQWGGTALTGRDISLDLAKLDVALSTRALEAGGNLASILAKLDVALSTRALEAGGNLATIAGKDFATQTTLALIKTDVDKIPASPATEGTLALLNAKIPALAAAEGTLAILNAKFVPLDKASLHGLAKAAGVDYFVADLAPTNTPCLFRIMVSIDGAGVFSAKITKAASAKVVSFNGGVALVANALYAFDLLVHSGDTVNLQHTVAANINVCRVQEIIAGVQ